MSLITIVQQMLDKHYTPAAYTKTSTTVHHSTTLSLQAIYDTWQVREASAQYGVHETEVRQFVEDDDYAWATGSTNGNKYSISIEHVNSAIGGDWPLSDATLDTGAKLIAYLHVKHGMGRPSASNVHPHKYYVATACPGPYFSARLDAHIAAAGAYYDQLAAEGDVPAEVIPVPVGHRLLKQGMTGEDVKVVQAWAGSKVDGIFGPLTAAAVKAAQRSLGLAADGIVGPQTWAAIDSGAKPTTAAPVIVAQPVTVYPTVRYGSTGANVKALQQLLNAHGAGLTVDGVFGAKTLAAVKAFQKAHGLAVDGIVGPKTWAALAA